MHYLESFEKLLDRVLEEKGSCEGKLPKIKIKKYAGPEIQRFMSKGLVGYLEIYLKKPILPEYIQPFLKNGEYINITYKRFLEEKEIPLTFEVIKHTKQTPTQETITTLLHIKRDYNNSIIGVFVKEKNGIQYINYRSRELIRKILANL